MPMSRKGCSTSKSLSPVTINNVGMAVDGYLEELIVFRVAASFHFFRSVYERRQGLIALKESSPLLLAQVTVKFITVDNLFYFSEYMRGGKNIRLERRPLQSQARNTFGK